ncbi:MAG: DUF4194 domain-containing protein [Verrucomicrobiales bacterium]|nr:DUF4194 domain-containing protein [Verrucomicrobiales bacterium]MCP5528392.1 DUF4194 domain-containing protein [Verrucomicrobiales bacterium]
MPLPWPSFWQHIRVEDRPAISDVLTELLAHGALIGDAGRDRELFLLAREHQQELGEYFAPLHLILLVDPDRPILQLRPVPGDCGLLARFNKAETLLVLTLWRLYHDTRLERPVETVVVTANDIWHRLKLYFEHIEPPREAQLREMLIALRRRRLVRLQWHEEAAHFGESQIEILPTLPRTIPFENAAAWEEQSALYQAPASSGTDGSVGSVDSDESDESEEGPA